MARIHTRLLLLVAFAAALAVLVFAGVAGAQETTSSATEEVLSRYDSRAVAEMAAVYEQNRQRREELEDAIEAAEDAGEYERRSDLWDELSDLPDETAAANALCDARLSDIESAPLRAGAGAEAKAAELREKAASLDSLEAFAATEPINIDSRLYSLMGSSEASELASTYRKESGVLEVEANAAEVARQERESAEEAAKPEPKPEENPDGGNQPVEEEPVGNPEVAPEPAPEAAPEAPAAETGDDGGFLAGVNIVPIAAFVALVGAAIFALSRSAGVSIGQFFSPAMAQHRPSKKPKTKAAPKPLKTKAATTSKTGIPKPSEEPETETEPRPEPETETIDSKALAEWFEKEVPSPPTPKKPGPRDEAGDDAADDEEPPD